MVWVILGIWFLSFGLCMWLERLKLVCIKHMGISMFLLFIMSGLAFAPVLLIQLLLDRLLLRVRVGDEKALNRLR